VVYIELDYDDYQRYREETRNKEASQGGLSNIRGIPKQDGQLSSHDEAYHQGFAKGRKKDGSLAGLPREIPGSEPRCTHGIADVFCTWLSDR
jgi:hypothetical protein